MAVPTYLKELKEKDGFQVEKIVVPDEYQEAEKYNLHQSFIDPPGKIVGCSPGKADRCMFSRK